MRADNLPVIRTKIHSIEVFKNGVGFVNRTGEADLSQGWGKLESIPTSTLGSLWIGTTGNKSKIVEMENYRDKVTRKKVGKTIQDLMTMNAGKKVAITFMGEGGIRRVEGSLVAGQEETGEDVLRSETGEAMDSRMAENQGSQLVLIRTVNNGKESLLTLPKGSIQSLELLEEPVLSAKSETEKETIKIRVERGETKTGISMNYLQKGLAWSPSYRINLADDKNASIGLEAILINDVEDVENVDVSFVVGFPHFLYMDVSNPLAVRQSVGNFLQALVGAGSERNQILGNSMTQSAIYNSRREVANDSTWSANISLPGESSQDLYFYKQKGVTLKKGDRGRYSVFNANVPYEHIYQWEIPDTASVDDRGYRQDPGAKKEIENQVWHVVRLQNTTKQPWTTAPAFAAAGDLPVAQDLLGYAPPGAKSTLKLTVAAEIKAEQTQNETARKGMTVSGISFEEVMVEGKLHVTNMKSQEICAVIHKTLVGTVTDAGDGKVTKSSLRLMAFNSSSDLDWEFHLGPGKEREITYQYKVLLRR
ncbi:MAG: hypothetical protein JWN25_791 [Verrucomicrobiales bacterium]|nr:hypothetical protein [Verrucomicrobiales bacterium]